MPEQNDEIDLLALFAKIVIILRNNLKSLILAFIIGTVVGLIYYQLAPKQYKSKMILESGILATSYSDEITESLDNLILENNTKMLAERLNLSVEEAAEIDKIEIENFKKEKEPKDKDEPTTFIVTVKVRDKGILLKLQAGIINYISNNEFVKIRVKQHQKLYKTMIEKIDVEINSLDSLKRRLFMGQPIYSKTSEMLLVDPTNIYSKIIDLNREKLNLQNSLELVNSIQLVEGFTLFDKPDSPRLSLSLAAGAFLGWVCVGIILGWKSLRKIVELSEEKLAKP
jgi:hypothetical protein